MQNYLYKKNTSNVESQVQIKTAKKIKYKLKFLINKYEILAFIKFHFYTRIKLLTHSKIDLIDQKIITIDLFF